MLSVVGIHKIHTSLCHLHLHNAHRFPENYWYNNSTIDNALSESLSQFLRLPAM